MAKKFTIALGSIGVLAAAIFLWWRTHTSASTETVQINRGCAVDRFSVQIGGDGQVRWKPIAENNSITFTPSSPFTGMVAGIAYTALQGQTLTSGPVDSSVPNGTTSYSYNVTGNTPGCMNDPVVVVQK